MLMSALSGLEKLIGLNFHEDIRVVPVRHVPLNSLWVEQVRSHSVRVWQVLFNWKFPPDLSDLKVYIL